MPSEAQTDFDLKQSSRAAAPIQGPQFPGSPKKVLHVLNGAGGGAAMSTIGLIRHFRDLGIAACAVCHDAGSAAERERLSDSVGGAVLFTPLYWLNRKIRADLWKRPLLEARQLWQTGWMRSSARRVAEFANEHNVDLIHTNTILTPEGGLAARRLGLPHVWHPSRINWLAAAFCYRLEQAKVRSFCSPSCIGGDRKFGDHRRHCPRLDSRGLDAAWFRTGSRSTAFAPRAEHANAGRPLVVAMLASLSSRSKKHALFVDAASRLADLPNVEFRIYGHDSTAGGVRPGDHYAEEIHRLIREARLTNRFTWPGHVDDPVTIMGQIDILVHAADNESFGRTVVEAMAAGLPVVGVRGGGVAETIVDGETGFLAPADDPAGLAACYPPPGQRLRTSCPPRRRRPAPCGTALFARQLCERNCRNLPRSNATAAGQ